MSYTGCVYQFLLVLKQFLQSYNKKFHVPVFLNSVLSVGTECIVINWPVQLAQFCIAHTGLG